ncbi:hypothetical protein D3C86_1733220 [compost metagenome]
MILCRSQPFNGMTSRRVRGNVKQVAIPGNGVKRLVGSVISDPGLGVGAFDAEEWFDRQIVAKCPGRLCKKRICHARQD